MRVFLAGVVAAALFLLTWLPTTPETRSVAAALHEDAAALVDGATPRPFEACFAPGTDPATVAYWTGWVESRVPTPPNGFFSLPRWETTASGAFPGNGKPAVVTYSFVPDGSVQFGDQALNNVLHARLNAEFGAPATWKQIYRECFDVWSRYTGITFIEEPADDKAAMPESPGVLGVRGDIRIAAFPLDGEFGVLAFNFFPAFGGDQVLDSQEDWGFPDNQFRFFRNVVEHELGHAIGLLHTFPIDFTKLMEPFIIETFDGPQDDDIRGGTYLYGDSREDNAGGPTATQLPAFVDGLKVNELSLHNAGDNDWFWLPAPAGSKIAVTAEPVGASYTLWADPNDPGSAFGIDTRAILPLAIAVYDADGTTLLRGGQAGTPGQIAAAPGIELPEGDAGVFIRVTATGGEDDRPQRYRLSFIEQDADLFVVAINSFGGLGATVQLTPPDAFGRSQASLPTNLLYAANTAVTMVAPTTFGGLPLDRWIVNGASQPKGQAQVNLTVTGETALQVNYGLDLQVNLSGLNRIVRGETAVLTAVASGGAWPYTYAWSPADGLDDPTSAMVRANPDETTQYSVVVTDKDGKQGVGGTTVFVFDPLTADAGADRYAVIGAIAQLDGQASGGEPPHTFEWSPQVNPGNPEAALYTPAVNQTRTYTLTVRDTRGRTATDSVTVNAVMRLSVGLPSETWIERGEMVEIKPRLFGGAPPFKYVWFAGGVQLDTDEPVLQVSPDDDLAYLALVTDSLGIESSDGVTVRVLEPMTAGIEATTLAPVLGRTVMLKARASGGYPPYTFKWSPAPEELATGSTLQATPTERTEFTLEVMDSQQRVRSASVVVVPAASVQNPGGNENDNVNDNSSANDNDNDGGNDADTPGAGNDNTGEPTGVAAGLCPAAGFSTLMLLTGWFAVLARRERRRR